MTPAQVGALAAVALGAVTGLVVAGAVMLLGACASPLPTPAQQLDEGLWTAGDAKCIATGSTRAEIDACRDQLRIAGCGPNGSFADAGQACANVHLSDGGRP